jgi:TonB family protein
MAPKMVNPHLDEVFTADEVARATGSSPEQVEELIASGDFQTVAGTAYFSVSEAIRLGRQIRRRQREAPLAPAAIFAGEHGVMGNHWRPAFGSSIVHAVMLATVLLLSTLHANPAETEVRTSEPARMVFLVSPGPGGGGGGGGLRNPLPAPRLERKAPAPRRATSVPTVTLRPVVTTKRDVPPPKRPTPAAAPTVAAQPSTPEPAPLPTVPVVAPVVATASDARDRQGVIERGHGNAESEGSGTGGGAGTGQGTGNGEGLGSGIGDGSGGGTGGGPYRPGSGIEPPRLVREVKADYTEEARRRGITGDVVLEIVVRRDGTVGDVRVVQGLGAGLEQRAAQAVRQWRFEPARRKGVPVDVLVEVAVEFLLR